MPTLDPECPDARVLLAVHEKRARIAAGLSGSRLAEVVLDQRSASESAHFARCDRCQRFERTCGRCGQVDAHAFLCKDNPHRWRALFARAKPRERAPHEVLGIPSDATLAEARHAYRALALVHHPDHATRHGAARAGERMREINAAFDAFERASRR